ncbi:Ltp family lipoprotein [Bacillus infantis]|uniref:Ltp family lipoprotein n=1 Tax=Bacillus infantis TaxID=324767 RepID=UPI003CF54329
MPGEHKAALAKAKAHAKSMYMSKAGTYDQLTSEYGENFPSGSCSICMLILCGIGKKMLY